MCSPRKIRTFEIASAGFSGQASVAKIIHISSIQEALSLRGGNLKLRQANSRAQAKVARARARVCRGLATPLPESQPVSMDKCHLSSAPIVELKWLSW